MSSCERRAICVRQKRLRETQLTPPSFLRARPLRRRHRSHCGGTVCIRQKEKKLQSAAACARRASSSPRLQSSHGAAEPNGALFFVQNLRLNAAGRVSCMMMPDRK